jgi:hypothetical protein
MGRRSLVPRHRGFDRLEGRPPHSGRPVRPRNAKSGLGFDHRPGALSIGISRAAIGRKQKGGFGRGMRLNRTFARDYCTTSRRHWPSWPWGAAQKSWDSARGFKLTFSDCGTNILRTVAESAIRIALQPAWHQAGHPYASPPASQGSVSWTVGISPLG